MNSIGQGLRALVLALQYFTRVPVPAALARWTGFDPGLQRSSLAHFPGVGLLVAVVAIACYGVFDSLLPRSGFTPLLAAALSTAATVWLTGGLHEDGLADTADGLGGGRERETALAIMKDPRIGSFGALALTLALLVKIGVLSLIGSVAGWSGAAAALLGGHAISRGLTLAIVATLPNIGSAATSKSLPVTARIGWSGLAIAAAWCGLALVGAASLSSPAFCIAGSIAAAAALLWLRRLLARRLQGFTGDCLGAAQQLCEIAFYLGAAIALGGA